ncbi:MAG: hypothetical protein AVDCRST_MAG87-2838, partial [uncultured Thermomicrobiales bacterium]
CGKAASTSGPAQPGSRIGQPHRTRNEGSPGLAELVSPARVMEQFRWTGPTTMGRIRSIPSESPIGSVPTLRRPGV